jgi:hypothetical protein
MQHRQAGARTAGPEIREEETTSVATLLCPGTTCVALYIAVVSIACTGLKAIYENSPTFYFFLSSFLRTKERYEIDETREMASERI